MSSPICPSTNFGSSAVLKNNTTPDTRAYLKFNLAGIAGTVTKATFRAYTQTSSGSGYELHGVADNSWVEPGLTYSNRPAVGGDDRLGRELHGQHLDERGRFDAT